MPTDTLPAWEETEALPSWDETQTPVEETEGAKFMVQHPELFGSYHESQFTPHPEEILPMYGAIAGAIAKPMELAGEGIVKAIDLPAEIHNKYFNRSSLPGEGQWQTIGQKKITLPRAQPRDPGSKIDEITAGLVNTVMGAGEGMIGRPQAAFTLPFLGGQTTVAKAAQILFGAQMTADLPEAVNNAIKVFNDPDSTLSQKTEAIGSPVVQAYIARSLLKHAGAEKGVSNASQVQEAAAVHGDVRPLSEPTGEVPKPGSGAGVQPQAAPVAEEAQVPLSPEGYQVLGDGRFQSDSPPPLGATNIQSVRIGKKTVYQFRLPPKKVILSPQEQAYLDAERKSIDAPVEIVDDSLPEGQPFAGKIATINRGTGSIIINAQVFSKWLNTVPLKQRAEAVRSLLSEEQIHLSVDDASALEYWNNLTAAEKAISRRRYTGTYEGKYTSTGQLTDLADVDFGHEALRFRMQQLSRITPREIAEAAGRERWTMKRLTAVESAIRAVRETLGTKASAEQLAILDRIQANVETAKVVASGASAEAIRKKVDEKQTELDLNKSDVTAQSWFAKMRAATEPGPTGTRARQNAARTEFKQAAETGSQPGAMFKGRSKDYDIFEKNVNEQNFLARYATDALLKTSGEYRGTMMLRAIDQGAKLPFKPTAYEEALLDDYKNASDRLTELIHSEPAFASFWFTARRSKEGLPAIGPGVGPGALFKGHEPKEHPELLLPPTKGKGTLSRPETQKATEVLDEARTKLYQPVTGTAVQQLASSHLSQSARPSFSDFASKARMTYGDNLQPGQLRDTWIDSVWNYLTKASGQELSKLRDSLGIAKDLGTGTIAEPIKEQPSFQLTGEESEGGVGRSAEDAATIRVRQNYRNNVIARIGEKLIRESEEGKRAWKRSEIKPEDVGFWRESTEGAWRPIDNSDIQNPDALGRVLTEGAGVERSTVRKTARGGQLVESRKQAAPESVTKRVTILLDKVTGRVDAVSTYRSGRAGAMLVDPRKLTLQRPNAPLAEVLKRYRPIYSVLLDEPVQNFHQRFESLVDFENRFGKQARELSQRNAAYEESLSSAGASFEGTEPGILKTGDPLSDSESAAIINHLYDEVDRIESPEDIRIGLVDALHASAAENRMTGRDWQIVSALQKMVDRTMERYKVLTVDQAIEATLDEIYDLAKKSDTGDQFVQSAMARFGPKAEAVVRATEATPGESEFTRELIHRRDVAPTTVRPEHLPKEPAAMMKVQHTLAREFEGTKAIIGSFFKRRETKIDITRYREAAENNAALIAREFGNSIRVRSDNPMMRAAAKAIIAAGGDQSKLQGFLDQINLGKEKAAQLMRSTELRDRVVGHAWNQAADRLKAEVEFADQNWNNAELRNTAGAVARKLKEEFDFEKKNGVQLAKAQDYVPGRYDAEFFNDDSITFGERILGRNFRKAKVFPNYYSAIEAGPYIPKNYDVADLVEHRVRQGRLEVNKRLWIESLKGITDPVSNQPIIKEPLERDLSPGPEYEAWRGSTKGKLYYVRQGYRGLMDTLTMESGIRKSELGKTALYANAFLKHGVILILDTFHPGRLIQYGTALSGRVGYKGGLSALEYAEEDLAGAVKRGYITQAAADWSSGIVKLKDAAGKPLELTRRQVLQGMIDNGLNVGRLQDALYMDVVKTIPVVGALNRWVFDKFSRGLLAEDAVRQFEKYNQRHSGMGLSKLSKFIVDDMNTYYGSIGKQGWIRNPVFRDITQLIFLAPQWVEGLVKKEAVTAYRMMTSPARLMHGEPILGPLGSGVSRGLLGYFVLTQLINLMTRRQPTWKNDEPGHKLDAWIPTGDGSGFWLSPMSVFGEITHDITRLMETKPNTFEAIRQVGMNKLGPWGRLGMVLATRENSYGQRLTSTGAVAKEAAKQLAPVPISLGTPIRAALHTAMPGLVAPPRPGALLQRGLGAGGIKVQTPETPSQTIQVLADRFVKDEGLKHFGAIVIPTDEPSYSKLRSALRADDQKGAASLLNSLRQYHSDGEIIHAMKTWSVKPFTGSKSAEQLFIQSLTPQELDKYTEAQLERQEQYSNFLDFMRAN